MKLNKFAIVSIILLAILTFSAVSAANNTAVDDLTAVGDSEDIQISLPNEQITAEGDIAVNTSTNHVLQSDNAVRDIKMPGTSDNCVSDMNDEKLRASSSNDVLGDDYTVITPDNIGEAEFYDGNYKFVGEFQNSYNYLYFNSGCVIDGSEATFVNMGLILFGNVQINGLTMISNMYLEDEMGIANGALLYIGGDGGANNIIDNLNLTYAPEEGYDVYGVLIENAENFQITNSNITLTATNMQDYYEYAMKIVGVTGSNLLKGNTIIANLPILDVDYSKGNPGLDTDLVLNTGIKDSKGIDIINNTFIANVIDRNGEFPTLDCVMIENSNCINIINNTLIETDDVTQRGETNYLNVLDMYYSSDVLVKGNTIHVESNGGSENAGTSYCIQLTGPYQNVVIEGNDLFSHCEGPALGVYSQNYYGDTEILVQNNKIDVTGLPTSNSWGLVSGIELQDNVARVYNNQIKTRSITGESGEGLNIYGISYAQVLNNNHNYDIQGNTIETEGSYTIYLLKAQDTTVKNNYLISSVGEGDATVLIQNAQGTTIIENNKGRKTDDVVTPDNFDMFFDDDGKIKADMQFDKLIFKGEFDSLVDYLLIEQPIVIIGDDAVLNNMGIYIVSDDVKLDKLNFTADISFGSLIVVEGSNVNLTNLNIHYSPGEEEGIAVDIGECDDVCLLNSTIFFESHVPDDSVKAVAVQVVNTQNVLIDGNNITTKLPCVFVNNYDEDYFMMGSNNVNPVRLKDCSGLVFTNNNINSTTNDCTASFPTIQSIFIVGCTDSLINRNNISMVDEMTPSGMDNYMYGINFGYNTNVTFSNNIFTMFTRGGKDAAGTNYAFQGVQSEVIIRGNNITSKSYGPNLGIYVASMFGEGSKLLIEDNFINVTGYASPSGTWALVSGIEIQNGDAKIYNNTIYTYNVNEYDDNSYIYGISYAQWMYGTRGFDIQNNTIYTEGKYTISVIDSDYLYAGYNTLYAHDLGGDDSIDTGACQDVELKANSPTKVVIDANPVWIGSNGTIVVNVPNVTGKVIIKVNNKEFPAEELDNGVVIKQISAEDLVGGINNITVTYEVSEFVTTVVEGVIYVADGVVTQDTYEYYFNQADAGRFFDYVPEGVTLDFQGKIINPDSSIEVQMTVNKPVNIVSTTEDAYVCLNTVAGSLIGDSPGNSFAITNGGSGTNVTGITFYNTQLWLTNTHYVVLDNISAIVKNQRVGSGVGTTSIRENSTFVTVKNSYFYTENNGGSSSLVLAWAYNCIWENNTIEVVGNVGNMLYLNTFNVDVPEGVIANQYNIIRNNVIYSPNAASAISWGIVINGQDNLVENNTVYYKGVGIAAAYGGISTKNIYKGNKLYNGSSIGGMGSFVDCTFEDNYISGTVNQLTADCKLYNNTIDGKVTLKGAKIVASGNIINNGVTISGENIIFKNNNVTSTLTVSSNNNIIKGNYITSTNNYAVDLGSKTGNNVTDNYLVASEYKGDKAVKYTNANNVVKNNLPKVEITVVADSVWIGNDAVVTVNVINGTGSVTIEVNGKSYSVDLNDNGIATKEIPVEDLIAGENSVVATYESAEYAPATNGTVLMVFDGVVTQDNYMYYFNQDDNGKLFDYVPEGVTLDFQGKIINPDQKNVVQMNVNKPVNIISTTGDGYVDLNTTAGSLLGDSPGNSFAVTNGGSGSNITGIYFHNTQLWISNTHDVVLDGISVVVEDQRVGSGVGATTIRDNSSNVVLKNSYLYTKNNGGSTTFTFSWATNCTIDNCTVKAEGDVGNLIYLNTFNIAGAPSDVPLNNNNKVINNRIYGKEGSAISIGLMVEGQNNLIENNTLYKSSISISFGSQKPYGNTYIGNTMTDGGSLTAQQDSIIYNNNVSGSLSIGKESIAYNNTVGKSLTVPEGAIAYNNTVGTTVSISGKNAVVENNTIAGAVTIAKAATNTTFAGNDVTATVTVNSNDNNIKNNIIISSGDYAVDLKTSTGNNVTGNYLIAKDKYGYNAVLTNDIETTIIEDNKPYDPELVVKVDDIVVGSDVIINIVANVNVSGVATVVVDGKTYAVNVVGGLGTKTISDLIPSDYTVAVTFSSSVSDYGDSEYSTIFNVAKLVSDVNISVSGLELGNNITIAVGIPGATGNVTIIVNGQEEEIALDENGNATYTIEDIVSGDYDVVVIYPGDKEHEFAYATYSFTVDKLAANIKVEIPDVIRVGDSIFINVTADTTADLVVIIDGVNYAVEEGIVSFVATLSGMHSINVVALENGEFNSDNVTVSFVADKKVPIITIGEITANIGDKINVVHVTDSDGALTVKINGEEVTGEYEITKAGTYTVTVESAETDSYIEGFAIYSFTVPESIKEKTNATFNIPADFKPGDNITVSIPNATGNISVIVDGKEIIVLLDENGIANVALEDITAGNHNLVLIYPGDENHEAIYNAFNFSVPEIADDSKLASKFDVAEGKTIVSYVVDYGAGERSKLFNFKITDSNGNPIANAPVQFKYDTKTINLKSDSNGVVSLGMNTKIAGTYVSTLIYAGDDKHNATSVTFKFTLNKKKVTIKAKSKAFKAKVKVKKYTITLKTKKFASKDGKSYLKTGLKVTLKVKGKKYTAKINKKGKATFKIKKLTKKGNYKAKIIFAGSKTYNAVTKKVKIKVN